MKFPFTPTPRTKWLPLGVSLLFTFVFSEMNGQTARNLPFYSQTTKEAREKMVAETTTSIRAAFHAPEKFNKEALKAYEEAREAIVTDVSEEINGSALPDDLLWAYLKRTHAAVVAANPEAASTKVILTANPTPNAFSIGDGTIVVYTGLMAGLENEDQLAFVLCHEIAHYLLHHSTHALTKRIQTLHSKEFKSKVEAAGKQEYNSVEQVANIYKNVLLNNRYHHRDLERQADSMAYRLYVKTSFEPLQSQRLVQLFEFIDEPFRDTILRVEQRFGCESYPFKKSWLEQDNGSVWGAAHEERARTEKSMEDSLRTHPDWRNRLQWLEAMAGKKLPSGAHTIDSSYASIRFLSALECVEAWFDVERYDRSLYYALLYEKVYPGCDYFREIQALSLYGLYEKSKEHKLSDVLAQRSPDQPEPYNQFLDFLNNLRIKDLQSLQSCGTQALKNKKSEYALLSAYCMAKAQEDTGAMAGAKKEYLSAYRNGRFAGYFKDAKP